MDNALKEIAFQAGATRMRKHDIWLTNSHELAEFARLVRSAALEEAAKVCHAEADRRWAREKDPMSGDDPKAQGHKAVTARQLARTITALIEKEPQP